MATESNNWRVHVKIKELLVEAQLRNNLHFFHLFLISILMLVAAMFAAAPIHLIYLLL